MLPHVFLSLPYKEQIVVRAMIDKYIEDKEKEKAKNKA